MLGINRRWRKEKDKNFLSIYYLENRGSNMIKELKLKKPFYHNTTVYGHFGKKKLPYERLNKSNKIRAFIQSL